MSERQCTECGGKENLKRGWTNSLYCSERCERKGVSRVHASMPGADGLPRPLWVPDHVGIEISGRWEDTP